MRIGVVKHQNDTIKVHMIALCEEQIESLGVIKNSNCKKL